MIANLIGPLAQTDSALKGISRTRFSFHFTTARKRRWLLVQLVTAPALSAEDDTMHPGTHHKEDAPVYENLLEDYQGTRITRFCI